MPDTLVRWLPCAEWGARYNRATALDDAIAALIVTILRHLSGRVFLSHFDAMQTLAAYAIAQAR